MSFIINTLGKVTDCISISRDLLIEQRYSCSILEFLKAGGVRVKVFREHMAVEYRGTLNTEQLKAINKRLRQVDIYCLVADNGEKYRELKSFNRPIRRFNES